MDKKNIKINFCTLDSSSLEELLINIYSPSKNKLKQFFPKNFLVKKLRARDEVSIPVNFANDKEINPIYEGPELEILFEDEKFLALNKPANIFIHPLTYEEKNNCLSFLRSKNLVNLNVNKNNYDRGLLYRLDFETSGVIVFVKNEADYDLLRASFNQLTKEKIYKALVNGKYTGNTRLENYLKPFGPNGQKMVEAKKEDGDLAVLEILNSEYKEDENQSLLTIKLHQGLRHQIRAQLMIAGHPIVGDLLYGGSEYFRLCLHAHKYLISYQDKNYQFTSNTFNF